jgi:predicted small lipoprotein YifL
MYLNRFLLKSVLTLCLFLPLIAACGQRGPLYLPDQSPTTAPAQDQQPASDELPQRTEVEHDAGR